jgi:hypothetical protein
MSDEAPWGDGWPPHLLLGAAVFGRGKSRRLRLCAVAFCRQLLHLLPDERHRQVIQVVEDAADRRSEVRRLVEAREQTNEVLGSYASDLSHCGSAARWNALRAVRLATLEAADAAAAAAAEAIAYAAHPPETVLSLPRDGWVAASYDRALAKAQRVQADVIREIARDPFKRTPSVSPSLPRSILSVAQAAYDERLPSFELDPLRLSVLADALEEAGGSDESILSHLRSAGSHVRGCWALDLVLGKP